MAGRAGNTAYIVRQSPENGPFRTRAGGAVSDSPPERFIWIFLSLAPKTLVPVIIHKSIINRD